MYQMGGPHRRLREAQALRVHPEWKRPDCDIAFDRDLGVWGATLRLSGTSTRCIVGPTLPELQVKLVMRLGAEGREAG